MAQPDLTDEDLGQLVERVRAAAGALMQGDARRYFELVNEAPDFTLMPPTGGPTRRGPDTSPAGIEALENFFAGSGDADFELEQSYASGDLVVLVGVERQHGTVRRAARAGLVVARDPGVPSRGSRLATGASARRRSRAADQHGSAFPARTRRSRSRLAPGSVACAR